MQTINQIEPYITKNEITALEKYIQSGGWLTEFKKTREFEEKVAEFLGAKYAIAVTSGMVALYLSLLAKGIGKGDKVVVPNFTMIATINAVKWAGAEPILADVEPQTLCLDLNTVKIDESVKAILYVAINGRTGDMLRVQNFCRGKKIALIEDSCQAMGSKWGDSYLGCFGELGNFSFTPHKLITTGQGGMVVTNSLDLCNKIRKLKDFSRVAPGTDWHDAIGYNFKFTDLQSVVGLEQLKSIEFRVKKKKEMFGLYRKRLEETKEVEFLPTGLDQTTPWSVDVLLPSMKVRDELVQYLTAKGIRTRPFYPPINWQKPFSNFEKGLFPISEGTVVRGLWLPSSIGLEEEQVLSVCREINGFFGKTK